MTLCITVGEGVVERWRIGRLDSSDAEVRLAAAHRLGEMESTLAIRHLLAPIRAGEQGDLSRQQELLVAMGEFALPFLLDAFDDGDVFVRLRLLSIFTQMGLEAKPAIPRLLQVEHEYLFAPTTEALATMDEPGQVALFELLAHERVQFRAHAAQALGELRPDLESWLTKVATSVDSREPNARRRMIDIAKGLWRDTDPDSRKATGRSADGRGQ